MTNQQYLIQSTILSLVALALLIAGGIISNTGNFPAGQEIFETIGAQAAYTSSLTNAAPALRTVLFIDAIFALAYTSAICFAILGFAHRNKPVAWFAGLGIIVVMLLDYLENTIMGQSMDLLEIGSQLSIEHIIFQATVSAIKWQASAATLFAISFLLPNETLVEKLLVWGTRLGLAISVPMFLINPFELRELGVLFIGISMASGFLLLSVVTWRRAATE